MEINIEEIVKENLQGIDFTEEVRSVIKEQIRGEIFSSVKKVMNEECSLIINSEIKNWLAQPILTDNGWGEKKQYASLEDMFKKTLHEQMKGGWDMQRRVEDAVKKEVQTIMDGKKNEVIKKVVDELTKQ